MAVNIRSPAYRAVAWVLLVVLMAIVAGCDSQRVKSADAIQNDPPAEDSVGLLSQPTSPSQPTDLATATPSSIETTAVSRSPTAAIAPDTTVAPGANDRLQITNVATAMPVPSPSSTPTPALRQLTSGGCCTQPFWSPDSRQVLFIDKPGPDNPVGIWGVDVTQPDPTPELVTERIAFSQRGPMGYTADMAFLIELNEGATVIEQLSNGTTGHAEVVARWTVPAGGRPVSISPGRKRIAWQVSDDNLPFERRTTQVWIANLDGSDSYLAITLPRGSFGGWISDDVLLLQSRESLESRESVLYTFSLTDEQKTELARAERLRGGFLSPDGAWLAYYVALNEDPAQNGLWLVRTDGSAHRKLDRDLFGAYQWRDGERLLIIPFRPKATSHELWEFEANTGKTRRLTDPAITPFRIANGDWAISPDGRHIVFVESRDHNLWLLTLR